VRGGDNNAPTPPSPPSDRGENSPPFLSEWALEDLLFNLIIYRLYNKPITSDAVWWQEVGKYDRKIFEKKLRKLKESGEKIFTNAYMVSGYEQYASSGDKIARTSKLLEDIAGMIPRVVEGIISVSLSFPRRRESSWVGHVSWIPDQVGDDKNDEFLISQNTYEAIRSLPWLGEFLAYQIAVDLGYARPDLYDESVHVVAGPWCKRWLDRLFIDRWELSHEQAIAWLVENQEKWFASIWVKPDELFLDRKIPRLNLMAIENCLCEISKYLKVKYGEGRPRNRYQWGVKN
jgi:hypothetical protein